MSILLWTLSLLLGAVLLSALARRTKVPSPSLFALGGVLLAVLPHSPRISIDPNLALALFVAPILMDAGFGSSLRDLRQNWVGLAGLIFIAVAVTTVGVALVARWLVPSMPWAVAVTLGAAVSPPDAAAATAVLNEVRLPHRLLAVLENESLFNDASALLIYRLAVGAALTRVENPAREISTLALVLVGSAALGAVFAVLYGNLVNRFSHVPSSIALQFIGAFGIWILADNLELSGVLATLVAAIVLSRRSSIWMPAAVRVPSYAFWDAAVFMLNALAFILVGLQLGPTLDRLSRGQYPQYLTFAGAILATVIVTRLGWTIFFSLAMLGMTRILGSRTPEVIKPPPMERSVLAGWCGMRGIVTLAAVLALPDGSGELPAFPYRDLIVLAAVAVVIGTLIIQGFTLRPLVMMLRMGEDTPEENEIATGRVAMLKAALNSLSVADSAEAASLRNELSELLARADGSHRSSIDSDRTEIDLRKASQRAAREALLQLRSSGAIGEEAFHALETELDMVELETIRRRSW
jgi:CPA1 family monovalent cation:H+ antiporter